jgi:hypothetical protein
LIFVEEKAACPECGWKIDRTLLRGVPEIAYPFRISVGIPLAIFSLAVVIFVAAKYVSGFDDVGRRVEDTLAVLVLATLLAALNIPPFFFARKNRARYRAIPRDRRHLWSQGVMFVIGSVAVVVVVVLITISAIAARGR